jgi:putative ABC transport system permease protein
VNLGEVLRTSLAEIRGHKLRSVLTLLGVILGTLSITIMSSFLDGIINTVWDGFDDLGFDGVVYVMGREPRDLTEQAIFARSKGLQPQDAQVLLARGRLVSAVAPAHYEEAVVRRREVERQVRLMGVTRAYAEIRKRDMQLGRFFNDMEDEACARVCVLGHRLNRRLFGHEDPLGKLVMVDGRQFVVVGVAEKLGNVFFDEDDFTTEMEGMYVPLRTLRKYHAGDEAPLTYLAVKSQEVERLGDFKAEVEASLRLAHRGAEDFRVENIAEEMIRMRTEVHDVIQNWTIVLGTLAGISLLVGGIGLLSVMLISISERLYEIGLRKALGATEAEIFLQFLMESVMLSLLGGLVGAALGAGIIKLLAGFFPAGLPLHLGGMSLSILIALVLGALYGIYPALRAARVEPVEALRSAA